MEPLQNKFLVYGLAHICQVYV